MEEFGRSFLVATSEFIPFSGTAAIRHSILLIRNNFCTIRNRVGFAQEIKVEPFLKNFVSSDSFGTLARSVSFTFC